MGVSSWPPPALTTRGDFGMSKLRPCQVGRSCCCRTGMREKYMAWGFIPMDHWWHQLILGEWSSVGTSGRGNQHVISWDTPKELRGPSSVLTGFNLQLLGTTEQ